MLPEQLDEMVARARGRCSARAHPRMGRALRCPGRGRPRRVRASEAIGAARHGGRSRDGGRRHRGRAVLRVRSDQRRAGVVGTRRRTARRRHRPRRGSLRAAKPRTVPRARVRRGSLRTAPPRCRGASMCSSPTHRMCQPTTCAGCPTRRGCTNHRSLSMAASTDSMCSVESWPRLARWLRPGGHALIEASDIQCEQSCELFVRAGLDAHVQSSDLLGATVVIGIAAVGHRTDVTNISFD